MPKSNTDSINGFEFTEASVRHGFIRKVYSILMIQLLFTLGIVAIFVNHTPTKMWVYQHPSVIYSAIGVIVGTMMGMACVENLRRTFPTNVIFLGVFTLAKSFLLGLVAARYHPEAVIMAVGITAAVCLALTLFAFQTKIDFTGCGASLSVTGLVFLLFGLIKIFLPKSKTLTLVYASCGVLIFSFYLIYETQKMLGGQHKYSVSPEEYVFAALNIYLDIVTIFTYILQIIGASGIKGSD